VELNGAVAIVTGAAGGLGRAIAEAYAARGARVAAVDVLEDMLLETAGEIGSAGGTVLAIPTDATDPPQVDAMVAQAERELGPIDILVNCAGSLSAIGPVWEVDHERWWHDVTVNLCATFLCCRAVVKRMIERRQSPLNPARRRGGGGGYVLNMVGGGVGDPHAYTTGYACSKAGVMRLTEGLAQEAKKHGVKVFAMQPGAVRTAMTEFIMNSPEGRKWRPTFKRIFEEGRDAPADLVVNLALELVSGKFDSLTGRYFDAKRDLNEILENADAIIEEDGLTLRLRK